MNSKKPHRRNRNRKRGNGSSNGSHASSPVDKSKSKKSTSSSSRLSNRLSKNRRLREEWNEAVKVLGNTSWSESTSVELTGKFGKTIEQFASIKMPCSSVESSECTQVTVRLLKTYQILSNACIKKDETNILAQSLMIFCVFVRNVCSEQQASFTSEQLATLVPFLLPHVTSSSKNHAVEAMRTLSKVLLHNGDRCTLLYGGLVEALARQITSEHVSNALLTEAGDKTLRDCAMDCLSSLCLGASNTLTSKTLLIEDLKKGEFFIPLCLVIRMFVKKEDSESEDMKVEEKVMKSARRSKTMTTTSAWAALDGSSDDDDDDDDDDDKGVGSFKTKNNWERRASKTKHTAYDIVTVTSTCRALVGLIAVLPALGETDRTSSQLIVDLHRLSSFGVESGRGGHKARFGVGGGGGGGGVVVVP